MKRNSKQSNTNRAEETTEKLRKTLVFSRRNADIYDELEKMKKKKINISDYICTLIRDDLSNKKSKTITDNKLEEIQSQLNILQELIREKTFISSHEVENEKPPVEIVSAKDILVDDIDDMLGI